MHYRTTLSLREVMQRKMEKNASRSVKKLP